MNKQTIKTRFAPSPTGRIHLGNVRTALFNYLLAKRLGGSFVLRIEDTDRERSREEYVQAVQDDLLWLGLQWDEGPIAEELQSSYRQSQRDQIYEEYFDLLEQKDIAYPCFCSKEELALSRKVQLSSGRPPRYAGTCAHLGDEEISKRVRAGRKPVLRYRVSKDSLTGFEDMVRGSQSFSGNEIGDFIIRRADGTPAFFFCNAVDDALMGVTHVLRGEDHLTNTPRQIMLLEALELSVPEYGHISLIVGSDGSPLSKRHGSRSINELRETGYLPGAVNNYLARLGHHYECDDYVALSDLSSQFDTSHLGRAPARFDSQQLLYWQHESVTHTSTEELWTWVGSEVHKIVPDAMKFQFVEMVKPNVRLPEHASRWARIVFLDSIEYSDNAQEVIQQAGGGYFQHALHAYEESGNDYKNLIKNLKSLSGKKGKALFLPLRVALTGELDGPELAQLIPMMTPERINARLKACIEASIK
ncbi:MAG: glutamate--tRNA ligase [Gammaproteobacteria bacterium]